MGHYAKVVNGIVTNVIVAEQDFIDNYNKNFEVFDWVQTSYNTRGGVHYGPDGQPDGGVALRGNYAGVGYIYDEENDVFYPPKPAEGWTISAPDWTWKPPV